MEKDADYEAGRAVFVVIEPIHLVRFDLLEALLELDPTAQIISHAKPEAALAEIDAAKQITLALIAMGPQEFAGSRLAALTAGRGGRVILMGAEAEAAGASTALRSWRGRLAWMN